MARLLDDASLQYLVNTSYAALAVPITMSCFIYIDTFFTSTNDRHRFMRLEDTTGAYGYNFEVLSTADIVPKSIFCNHYDGSHAAAETTTGIASINTWNHVAAVFASNSSRSPYLNGGSKDTSTVAQNTVTSDKIFIGQGLGSGYTSGRIADVAIWNAALTDTEIAILALGYSPLTIRPQSLVSYWPLIGRTSPEIDLVGGYGLTLVNAPTAAAHPRIIYPSNMQSGLTISAAVAGAIMPQFQYANLGASLYNGTLIG